MGLEVPWQFVVLRRSVMGLEVPWQFVCLEFRCVMGLPWINFPMGIAVLAMLRISVCYGFAMDKLSNGYCSSCYA